MKRNLPALFSGLLLLLGAGLLLAQGVGTPHAILVVPDTTIEHPTDIGVRAHTNHLIMVRSRFTGLTPSGLNPPAIRVAYNLPALSSVSPGKDGGDGVIALVDAFDYPSATNDFDVFSAQFGLPTSTQNFCNGSNPCFVKVYATGSKPRANCGWGQEAALDIEWAHAMAPYAQIVLVEAKSNRFSDLFDAVDKATQIVQAGGYSTAGTLRNVTGAGQVSMSWGGSEFSTETDFDSHFNNAGVVYFASSGDAGGKTIYPSVSPSVVASGGTTLTMDGNAFVSETGWSGSGGGPSKYELRPSYQDAISTIVKTQRGAPDFSFDSDPSTGVSVYDSTKCQGLVGWLVFGGTSVASPSLSGIVNAAGHVGTSSTSTGELTTIYSNRTNSSDFRDITSGTAGSFSAMVGWDFVTGVGSNQGLSGK